LITSRDGRRTLTSEPSGGALTAGVLGASAVVLTKNAAVASQSLEARLSKARARQ